MLNEERSSIKDTQPRTAVWQWLLAGFCLVLFSMVLVDLVLHPLSPSDGPTLLNDRGTTFRYFSALAGTLNMVVGLLVVRKAPGNSLGLLLMVWGVSATAWSIRSDLSSLDQAGWLYLAFYTFFFCFAFPSIIAFLFLYPTGHFYPRWVKPWALAVLGLVAVIGVAANLGLDEFGVSNIPNPIYISWLRANIELVGVIYSLAMLLAILTPLLSLVVRYRQAGRLERQQIKWLVWLVAVLAGLSVLKSFIPGGAILVQDQPPLLQAFAFINFILYQSMGAIATAIAILRHRLWDIDVVIRKTLVYSMLSGLLGLVFFGTITVLQSLFSSISQQQSAISIVLSTLAIAVLFNPLRRRIQDFIDRRFYRQKYDAEKALAEFAAAARSQTDLEQLSVHLARTVQEALQPAQIQLLLRSASKESRKS